MTSSPAANPVTPAPVPATTPARSLPCPDGNVAGHLERSRPSRILASPGLIPAALTWTSTWPGPGTGAGTSTTVRTSTSPYSSNRTAFTRLPPLSPDPSTSGRRPVCPSSAEGSPAQPLDDLGGGPFGRLAVALSRPQRHPLGIPAGRGGGAQRPGGVVDLRIGGRRVRVLDDEPVDQPAGRPSAEGPCHHGGGVARIGQRGPVQRVRAAFRAAQEGGPALRRHRARGQHGLHLAGAHNAARRDLRQPRDRGDLADQSQQPPVT